MKKRNNSIIMSIFLIKRLITSSLLKTLNSSRNRLTLWGGEMPQRRLQHLVEINIWLFIECIKRGEEDSV